jgi:hypothetical protein
MTKSALQKTTRELQAHITRLKNIIKAKNTHFADLEGVIRMGALPSTQLDESLPHWPASYNAGARNYGVQSPSVSLLTQQPPRLAGDNVPDRDLDTFFSDEDEPHFEAISTTETSPISSQGTSRILKQWKLSARLQKIRQIARQSTALVPNKIPHINKRRNEPHFASTMSASLTSLSDYTIHTKFRAPTAQMVPDGGLELKQFLNRIPSSHDRPVDGPIITQEYPPSNNTVSVSGQPTTNSPPLSALTGPRADRRGSH